MMTSLFPSWRRFLHHPSNPDPPPLQTPTNREELFFFGFLNQKDLSSEGVSLCESIGVLKLNGGGGGEKIKQTLFLHLRRHRLNIFQLKKQNMSKDCNKVDHRECSLPGNRTPGVNLVKWPFASYLEDQEVNTWCALLSPMLTIDN